MKIKDFKLEKWLNPRDEKCKYNLGASCVKALSVEELFDVIGEDLDDFLNEVKKMSLHYGHFFGLPRLLEALSKMYRGITPDMILTVHGGTGANHMVITELVEPEDSVISIIPTYQQHYSIPESIGAEVKYLELKEADSYLPDLDELRKMVDKNTKMIILSNPNNPSGAYIGETMLKEIAKIAESVGAYILCDEIYRGLGDEYMASIVDIYDKGIATSSTSKVFSMAGTRVGWIVTKDKQVYIRLENRRSYDTICCGVFDELLTAIALEHYDKILERSKRIVRENKKILDDWIAGQPHLSCNYESFGSTVFIQYDYVVPSDQLCADIFEKTGVLLCHGDCFEIPRAFRLGYGFGNPDMFREGLKQLGDYFAHL